MTNAGCLKNFVLNAFMEAMGLVNDHIEGCHSRKAALIARAIFKPPV